MVKLSVKYLVCLFGFILFASSVVAQSWQYQFIQGERAGKISACVGYIEYRNATFVMRVYGEEMDFIFDRKDFTLPFGQELGQVSFSFREIDFVLIASTNGRGENEIQNTTTLLYMSPKKENYSEIFEILKRDSTFRIGFPNGDTYPVSLLGSSRVLGAISNCWLNQQTGPHENNPFGGNQPTNNPFDGI